MKIQKCHYPHQQDYKSVSTQVGTTKLTYSKSNKEEVFQINYQSREQRYVLPEEVERIPLRQRAVFDHLKQEFEKVIWTQAKLH